MDFKEALEKLPKFERYAVAFSGGADSLSLLHAASAFFGSERIVALHYEHGIRGAESEDDAAFCEKFAKGLGVRFFLGRAEAGILSDPPKGENREALARKMRYEWMGSVCVKEGIGCLLTAHHADDVAETLLMHLMRGAGASGLAGLKESVSLSQLIPGCPDITVLRPLLDLRARDCREYCETYDLPFRTDSTNSDTGYTRNWLRHEIVPKLAERAGGDLTVKLRRTARQLGEQAEFVREAAEDFLRAHARIAPFGVILDYSSFLNAKPALQREILRILAAGDGNWDFETLDKVLTILKSGADPDFQPPGTRRWLRLDDTLVFYDEAVDLKPFLLSCLKLEGVKERGQGYSDNGAGWLKWLKGESVVYREYLRAADYAASSFSNGLRYKPTNGPQRKVGDMMTDAKIPAFLRRSLPIVMQKDDPGWIPGWRISDIAALREGDEVIEAVIQLPGAIAWRVREDGDVC